MPFLICALVDVILFAFYVGKIKKWKNDKKKWISIRHPRSIGPKARIRWSLFPHLAWMACVWLPRQHPHACVPSSSLRSSSEWLMYTLITLSFTGCMRVILELNIPIMNALTLCGVLYCTGMPRYCVYRMSYCNIHWVWGDDIEIQILWREKMDKK